MRCIMGEREQANNTCQLIVQRAALQPVQQRESKKTESEQCQNTPVHVSANNTHGLFDVRCEILF